MYTDHLPLTTPITSAADYSPQPARHLSYITEFMTDLRHLPRKTNIEAMPSADPALCLTCSLHLQSTSGTWLYVNTLIETSSATMINRNGHGATRDLPLQNQNQTTM